MSSCLYWRGADAGARVHVPSLKKNKSTHTHICYLTVIIVDIIVDNLTVICYALYMSEQTQEHVQELEQERTQEPTFIQCLTCGILHHRDYTHPTNGYDYKCMRCEHEWRGRLPTTQGTWPKSCPKCGNWYWDRPRTNRVATVLESRSRARVRARAKLSRLSNRKPVRTGVREAVPKSILDPRITVEEANMVGVELPPPPSMLRRKQE